MNKLLFLPILFLPILAQAQSATLVVPQGHTAGIRTAAFSHDGQLLLTGSVDKTVKLWNLRGQLLQTFTSSAEGEYYAVGAVAFSQDDSYVIALTTDGYADIWDLYGNKIPLFEGRFYQSIFFPECPNCSPDGGPYFLTHRTEIGWEGDEFSGSVYETKVLTLANVKRDTLLSIRAPDTRPVAFSPVCPNCAYGKGDAFLTVSSWERATLYNLQGDTLLHLEFPGLQDAGFTPEGQYIYLRNEAGKLSLVDRQGQAALNLELPGLSAVHFAPACPDCPSWNGPALLTGQEDGSIRLFNLRSEEQQVFQEPGWKSLGFAPACTSCPYGNGKFILIAGQEDTMRIIDLQGNQKVAFATPHSSADFSFDGQRLLTHTPGDYSGTAKVWNMEGALLQEITYKQPPGLYAGFKPGGHLFLSTILYEDNSFRNIYWDMESQHQLEPVYSEKEFFLSFSADGQMSLSLAIDGKGVYLLRNLKGELIQELDADKWKNLRFSDDGQSLYTISSNDTDSSDESGSKVSATVWGLSGHEQKIDFRNVWQNGESYQRLSSKGNFLLLGDGEDRGSIAFLYKKGVGDITPPDSFYFYTDGHVAAFAPDERSILFGLGDGSAQWRGLDGSLIRELKGGHTGSLNSTAISKDNRFALTASNDGARLWELESGEELATILTDGDKNWVCITPNGLFDASPGAMERMYFSFGREVIELEQLKERYYEPNLLDKLLGFSDDPIRSVEGFDTVALYPIVTLHLDTQAHLLKIGLTPRNGGIGQTSVFINGKEVIPDANRPEGYQRIRDTSMTIELATFSRFFLQDSLNNISVRAYNEAGWLKSPEHTVSYRPRFARAKGGGNDSAPSFNFQPISDPALYAVIIGTANYAGTKLDLKFPGKDAAAMAQAIQQAGSQLFGVDSVVVRLFTTDTTALSMHPSKANIRAAFEDFKKAAKAEDILVVYLSGHGVTYGDADRAQFYYLTQEIASEDLSDDGIRKNRTISTTELTKWINDIPAQKQVMIIDACNSGKVVETLDTGTKNLNSTQIRALDRMKDRTGMFVLAGSAADKVSYEASQYGQGLLTYSILQGMSGFKLREDKYVDVALLFEYARDEVPKLAESIGGIQTPTMLTPGSGSIDIGIFNEQVHIPLSPKKPVFVRNYFQEETAFDDVLNIGELLESQLQEITAKGTQASLIYVDIPKYKDAYSIKGLYGLAEGRVSLQAKLFKGRTPLGDIQAKGQAGQLQELVDEVLKQAFGILQNE